MQEASSDSPPFTTYVIVELEDHCTEDVKKWFQSKLETPKAENGPELLTKLTRNFENKEVFLHVSATDEQLLKGAELIGLKKLYKNGWLKEVLIEDLDSFEDAHDMGKFLTQADRLRIIDYELNNLKLSQEEVILGENVRLYKYDGISMLFSGALWLKSFELLKEALERCFRSIYRRPLFCKF